ncbi:hypothetical protein ACIL4A_002819, partial [Enterococcus faecalis]
MKQKYINANIYRHDKATEFIVENGRFSAIGTDLGHADEIIDVKGKLIRFCCKVLNLLSNKVE